MEGQELIASLASVHAKLDKVLGYFKGKVTKSVQNANGYASRKERRRAEEDTRRASTVQNPDCLATEMNESTLNLVADAFAERHFIETWMLLLDDKRNNAAKIVANVVRFWNNHFWETCISRSGNSYACFTGWTETHDGRPKAKRQSIIVAGDIVFKPGKFTTTRPWGGDKAVKLGEPKMWRMLYLLICRVMFKMRYTGDMEDADDWAEINPECVLWLHLLCNEGYAFSDDLDDNLDICRPSRLYEYKRETFHRKIGKVLPILAAFAKAFDRGLEKTVGSC